MKLIESVDQLRSWDDYKEFLKLQLKTMEAGAQPFLVSKQKFDFEIDGKPWKGFAVMLGPKGQICARKLQKEGVVFREGSCSKSGKELSVDGLETLLVKGASKSLKMLRLGYEIAGSEAGSEKGGADDADGPGDGADLAPQAAKITKATAVWKKTHEVAKGELRKLQKALVGLDDPRSKPLVQGLEGSLAGIETVDDEARAVEAAAGSGDAAAFAEAREGFVRKLKDILASVEQNEVLRMADTNPLLEVKIRETYAKSLKALLASV